MHTLIFWDEFHGMGGWLKIVRNMFLFILGMIGMVFGTIYSIKDIIDYFINPPEEGNYPICEDVLTNETTTISILDNLKPIHQ